jgi:hypothetical protein
MKQKRALIALAVLFVALVTVAGWCTGQAISEGAPWAAPVAVEAGTAAALVFLLGYFLARRWS